MMGEMVDRVARAMAESRDLIWENMSEFSNADETPEYYRSLARAAIAAMREPTGEMIQAANPYVKGYDDMRSSYAAWQAMIDAALSPEQEQG